MSCRTQSRWKHLLIISIVLPLFVGNSVARAGQDVGRRQPATSTAEHGEACAR